MTITPYRVFLFLAILFAVLLTLVGFGWITPDGDWQPQWVFLGLSLTFGWASRLG